MTLQDRVAGGSPKMGVTQSSDTCLPIIYVRLYKDRVSVTHVQSKETIYCMAYVIHQVDGLPTYTEGKGQLLDSVSYPSHDLPDKISTKITLWEVEENVGGMLTWSYWRSLFNRRPDYNIIVHQNDPIKNKTYTFVIDECDTLDISEVAF